jgi:hypothetical protein
MNYWIERKMNNRNKRSHIKLTETDCELFGSYVEIVRKVLKQPFLYDNLSEHEKMTLDEGNRILSDINWFGWKSRNIKK